MIDVKKYLLIIVSIEHDSSAVMCFDTEEQVEKYKEDIIRDNKEVNMHIEFSFFKQIKENEVDDKHKLN